MLVTERLRRISIWGTCLNVRDVEKINVVNVEDTNRLLLEGKIDVFVQSFMGQWFDFRAYDSVEKGTLEHEMWSESWRTMAERWAS